MSELRVCRICLSTGVKMYRLDRFQLKAYYEEVMALKVNNNDNLPQYFCYECSMLLHKFHKFKEKCYCGQKALKEMSWKGEINYESISKLDRNTYNTLHSVLQTPSEKCVIKEYNFITEDSRDNIESSRNIKAEEQNNEIIDNDTEFDILSDNEKDLNSINENVEVNKNSHQIVFVDFKQENEGFNNIKNKEGHERNSITKRRSRFLDANNWKLCRLTEEEALKQFRERCEDTKYLRANFKCTDCYKGFSKKEMLNRHVQLRHVKMLGSYECRFCKMRFKWDSLLRIHMRQHFNKYQCLRCKFVCPLENTAFLHEEYHNGVTRKCIHCGKSFRHASTYYTHMRTAHRSEYICVTCGVSFVSDAGLHQHRRFIHCREDGQESPGDDEEVNTFCERCDIRFDSRKAYEEHLFHSLMHAEGVEHEIDEEDSIPRKVIGKRLKAKISKQLWKSKQPGDKFKVNVGKNRKKAKTKRARRKPTTCHQCGQHFDSQSACMKHHQTEHPRTSFYPTSSRYICELCGASLAPGSVAVHQNMHTREKMCSCETCGRQFHSTVGLKRHQVTHTGEKPFACTLCHKKFTQSNSMKLHYRTFHLKQPYPKRNRKKKPSENQHCEAESSDERSELDSLPDPDPEPELLVVNDGLVPESDETVHYLSLD